MVLGHATRGSGRLPEREREVRLVDAGHDVVLDERLHALDGRLRKYEDRPLNAGAAQLEAFLHRGDGELIGPGGVHRVDTADRPVAVGIGLDHAHHADAAGEAALERRRVAPQRREVDLDPGPPVVGADFLCHGRSFRTLQARVLV